MVLPIKLSCKIVMFITLLRLPSRNIRFVNNLSIYNFSEAISYKEKIRTHLSVNSYFLQFCVCRTKSRVFEVCTTKSIVSTQKLPNKYNTFIISNKSKRQNSNTRVCSMVNVQNNILLDRGPSSKIKLPPVTTTTSPSSCGSNKTYCDS